MSPAPPLPYGTPDLDPEVALDPGPPRRVRCYVRGCPRLLKPPARGDECPEHRIVCHHSRSGATYSYPDVRRNIIAAPDLLAGRVGRPGDTSRRSAHRPPGGELGSRRHGPDRGHSPAVTE